MWNKSVSWLCLTFALLQIVHSQICTRSKNVSREKTIREMRTYIQRYKAGCWKGWCDKTRLRTRFFIRVVPVTEVVYDSVCCEGYQARGDPNDFLYELICDPICDPPCNNADCTSPGFCSCKDGYVNSSPETCVPVCDNCTNGVCTSPNVCECNIGYILHNGQCIPDCNISCILGTCEDNICQCLEGYRKSDNGSCEPYCSSCENGTCVAPELCECNEGYSNIEGTCTPNCFDCLGGKCIGYNKCECESGYAHFYGTCQPICAHYCGNGKCVAPNTCLCESGYELKEDCEPHCCVPSCTDCEHGTCVRPGECECSHGYTRLEGSGACVPECKNCTFGICSKPGLCDCFEGYQLDESDVDSGCVPVCEDCEGKCIEPAQCVCDPPFEAKVVDNDCDNLSEELLTTCTKKTVCVLKSDTNPADLSDVVTDFGIGSITRWQHLYTYKDTDYDIGDDFESSTEGIDNESNSTTLKQTGQKKWYNSIWFYIIAGVLALLILFLLVFIAKRLINSFGGNYDVNV